MANILSGIKERILELESPYVLVPVACIPLVGTIVQVVKEDDLFLKIGKTRNQKYAIALLKEKNRISMISSVGLGVQAVAIFAIAIFAGAGFYAFAVLIPFGILIAYNISKIKYNQEGIEKLEGGSIFVPRVR